MLRNASLLLLLLLICFTIPKTVFAENRSFVTIVNPQRISSYTKNYLESFKAEKNEVESRNLPATWLVTYDVLSRDDFVNELKNLKSNQELGILLEVTPDFAKASGVTFNKVDNNWHRATSLFLSGYEQEDRIKLIDKVFKKFNEKFGYYPKSVGSWWTDSYSQDYMRKKYGITGNLGISDQYDLDGYSVWGTWWSVPYYPSKINAAVPAQSTKNKLNVLQFRWAARDPVNGYNNTNNLRHQPSLFSTQDYKTIDLPDSYFQNIVELYATKKPYNSFGQVTIGLEGDLSAETYKDFYSNQLDTVETLENSKLAQAISMQRFASWYSENFPHLSPQHVIESDDLLESNKKTFWFQNPFYRIGIEYDGNSNKTKIIDLREYYSNLKEPFYSDPNKQFNLNINLPFKIDTVIKPDSRINLYLGNFERVEGNLLIFEKGKIEFKDKEIILPSKSIKINNIFETPAEGLIYRDYSYTVPFAIKRRLPIPEEYILIGLLVAGGLIISLFKKKGVIAVIVFVLLLAVGSIIISPNYKFYISQDEYNTLKVLEKLPRGNTLVYDKNCLNCKFSSSLEPAAMAGKKGYVEHYSNQPTEINFNFQVAKTSAEAKKILKDKNIKYVYLSKYGDSIENLPYLPQDLGLERVYVSANAEIWKTK